MAIWGQVNPFRAGRGVGAEVVGFGGEVEAEFVGEGAFAGEDSAEVDAVGAKDSADIALNDDFAQAEFVGHFLIGAVGEEHLLDLGDALDPFDSLRSLRAGPLRSLRAGPLRSLRAGSLGGRLGEVEFLGEGVDIGDVFLAAEQINMTLDGDDGNAQMSGVCGETSRC
jgi:hypothetical protein